MIKESVSLVFYSQGQLYTIVRRDTLSAFPGYTAFPGGKVDPEDHHPRSFSSPLANLSAPLANACQREAKEELNIDLDHLFQTGQAINLSPLASATTPSFYPYRFRTHFFLVELVSQEEFSPGPAEIQSASWQTPEQLINSYEKATLLAVPPTLKIIRSFKKTRPSFIDLTWPFDEDREVPAMECLSGVWQFLPLSNTLPPANRTNSFLIGDKKRVLIDPSPKDKKEYEKFLFSLKKQKVPIDLIFLTHHHRDHHEYSPLMAKTWGVPLGLSKITHERIVSLWGDSYFKGVSLQFFKKGDILTESLGQKVRLYALPGHDDGQLGMAPDSHHWFLVGDLIQTVGTVVVGGDEGDMSDYMDSLRKVIEFSPRFVLPSHGVVMGGLAKLRATLEHRLEREVQIKELLNAGKNKQDILKSVYPDLSDDLQEVALKTIQAHMDKIERERVWASLKKFFDTYNFDEKR